MKKSTIILAVTMLFSGLSFAQTNPALLVGGTFSNIKTELFNTEGRTGFNAGFSFVMHSSEKFQTISEFYYETSGASAQGRQQEEYGGGLSDVYETVELYRGHASWSLIANYYFLKKNLGVQFGPSVKLVNFGRIEEPIKFLGEGTEISALVPDIDVYSAMSKFDFGLSFGLSAGFGDFMLSGRYNLGLRKFDYSTDGVNYNTFSNNSISLSLTYIMRGMELVL